MQYGLFSLSISILLCYYNPFIENKTCLTQALSNHHSFYVEEIFVLEKKQQDFNYGTHFLGTIELNSDQFSTEFQF